MKSPAIKKLFKKFWFLPTTFLLITLILIVSLYSAFLAYYQDKFFPGVKVGGYDLSGKRPVEVNEKLATEFKYRNKPIELTGNGKTFTLDPSLGEPELNIKEKTKEAFKLGRSGDYLKDLKDQLNAYFNAPDFKIEISYRNTQAIFNQLEAIKEATKTEAIDATLNPNTLEITESIEGRELDIPLSFQDLNEYLSLKKPSTSLSFKIASPFLSTIEAKAAKKALEETGSSPVKLKYAGSEWVLDQESLFPLLRLKKSAKESGGRDLLDPEKLDQYIEKISSEIYTPVKNARFNINPDTKRVTEFQDATPGLELDLSESKKLLLAALSGNGSREITLPVKVTQPEVTSSEASNLGIDELLAEGLSYFSGSIENRIYNLSLASSRINGVLIAPGEVFSFNQTIGDVTAATGYKPAYVIKSGRTVLDDGGGVCQVSTTLFRAVLNAGLPVVSRTAHAYRVGYYEQGFSPGLDATIFYPSVDFKFKNDTKNHILVQSKVTGLSLQVSLYGRNDGREVSLTKPAVWNISPAPPELRQDDPTLPKGTVKQVDWAASGAQVSFKRTVTRGGETIIDETFNSNYRPWQAVFLVGTKEN